MKQHKKIRTVTISREEYERLKKKEKFADNVFVQLKLSLDDIRHGRVHEFDPDRFRT